MTKRLPRTFLRRQTKRRIEQQQIANQVLWSVADCAQIQLLELVEDRVDWCVGMSVWHGAVRAVR